MLITLIVHSASLTNISITYIVYPIKMYVPLVNVLTRTHLARHQRERQGTSAFRLAYHD